MVARATQTLEWKPAQQGNRIDGYRALVRILPTPVVLLRLSALGTLVLGILAFALILEISKDVTSFGWLLLLGYALATFGLSGTLLALAAIVEDTKAMKDSLLNMEADRWDPRHFTQDKHSSSTG